MALAYAQIFFGPSKTLNTTSECTFRKLARAISNTSFTPERHKAYSHKYLSYCNNLILNSYTLKSRIYNTSQPYVSYHIFPKHNFKLDSLAWLHDVFPLQLVDIK